MIAKNLENPFYKQIYNTVKIVLVITYLKYLQTNFVCVDITKT